MPEKPENIPDETADEIAELRAERDQLTKLLLTQVFHAIQRNQQLAKIRIE